MLRQGVNIAIIAIIAPLSNHKNGAPVGECTTRQHVLHTYEVLRLQELSASSKNNASTTDGPGADRRGRIHASTVAAVEGGTCGGKEQPRELSIPH